MPKIQPVIWPQHPSYDRVVYRPGRRAHFLEYQEEKVDRKGVPYWDVLDYKAFDKNTRWEFVSKHMVKWYSQKHGGYLCNA